MAMHFNGGTAAQLNFSLENTSSRYQCPSEAVNCTLHYGKDWESFGIGRVPSYLAISSSGFSCIGSILIILVYLAFRDLRLGAQKIITFLAVADFVSAAGYIVGSANFLKYYNKTGTRDCVTFYAVCWAQATVTSWSSMASFAWTLILAFYFYMVMVYNKRQRAVKLMPLYHLIAWILPLFIVVPLTATKNLGYSPYAASNWCFVRNKGSPYESLKELQAIGFILLNGKFWEILTYIFSIFIYVHIVVRLYRHHHRQNIPQVIERPEKRLLFIPGLFLLLRMWGTAQFFYSIGVSNYIKNGCVKTNILTGFKIFGYAQAVGDPGQGWGNALLYIFLSRTVRRRLFLLPCRQCVQKLGGWLVSVANTANDEYRPLLQDQDVQSYGSQHNRQQQATLHYGTANHIHRTPDLTISSCDITEVECRPTPGAEAEPSSSTRAQDPSSSKPHNSKGQGSNISQSGDGFGF